MNNTVDVVFSMAENEEMKFIELQVGGNPADLGVWDLSQEGKAILRLPLDQLSDLVKARSMVASKQADIELLELSLQTQQHTIDKLRSESPAVAESVPVAPTPQYLLFELAKLITKV